ncbi:MAG: MarR family transcriptional regulator [Ktedonobacteraceae bacterium]|nr:MarR family transcriptional regulator [Ktedonobacteraceae bacterium]
MPEELREGVELQTTPGQLTLLQILVEQEQCTMQDLASHLGVTPPTVTAMVKRLLAQGYVERIHGNTDWRTVWVKPTEKGRRVVQVYECIGRALLRRRLEHLNEEERARLEAALPILRRLIELRD